MYGTPTCTQPRWHRASSGPAHAPVGTCLRIKACRGDGIHLCRVEVRQTHGGCGGHSPPGRARLLLKRCLKARQLFGRPHQTWCALAQSAGTWGRMSEQPRQDMLASTAPTSSTKMMLGAFCLASRNTSRTMRGPCKVYRGGTSHTRQQLGKRASGSADNTPGTLRGACTRCMQRCCLEHTRRRPAAGAQDAPAPSQHVRTRSSGGHTQSSACAPRPGTFAQTPSRPRG